MVHIPNYQTKLKRNVHLYTQKTSCKSSALHDYVYGKVV